MKTFTMKLPNDLLLWLENESKTSGRPKSALVRQILQQYQRNKPRSALDLAADLCGSAESGLSDLAQNRKYLKRFGQ